MDSCKFTIVLYCGFSQALRRACSSAPAEVLLESPHQVHPHSTVDSNAIQDRIELLGYLGFPNAASLATSPVEQCQIVA